MESARARLTPRRPVTASMEHNPARFAFPALIAANLVLAAGPWMVRLADVGPVAAGFWRLAIALPFLVWLAAAQMRGRPLAGLAFGRRGGARRAVLRRRSRRLARRDPAHQARQRDPVRQFRELHLRALRLRHPARLAAADAVVRAAARGGRRGAAARRQLRIVAASISSAICSASAPLSSTPSI